MEQKQAKRKPEPIGHHPYVQRAMDEAAKMKQGQALSDKIADKMDAQTIPYEDIKAPENPDRSDPGCSTCTGSLHKTIE